MEIVKRGDSNFSFANRKDEKVPCPECDGSGKDPLSCDWPCGYCHGTGKVTQGYKDCLLK